MRGCEKTCLARLLLGGAALQWVRENSFLGNPVERNARKSSPRGATELSPALQRWEKWEKRFNARRTTEFSPPLFSASIAALFSRPASAAEGRDMFYCTVSVTTSPCAAPPTAVAVTGIGNVPTPAGPP